MAPATTSSTSSLEDGISSPVVAEDDFDGANLQSGFLHRRKKKFIYCPPSSTFNPPSHHAVDQNLSRSCGSSAIKNNNKAMADRILRAYQHNGSATRKRRSLVKLGNSSGTRKTTVDSNGQQHLVADPRRSSTHHRHQIPPIGIVVAPDDRRSSCASSSSRVSSRRRCEEHKNRRTTIESHCCLQHLGNLQTVEKKPTTGTNMTSKKRYQASNTPAERRHSPRTTSSSSAQQKNAKRKKSVTVIKRSSFLQSAHNDPTKKCDPTSLSSEGQNRLQVPREEQLTSSKVVKGRPGVIYHHDDKCFSSLRHLASPDVVTTSCDDRRRRSTKGIIEAAVEPIEKATTSTTTSNNTISIRIIDLSSTNIF